MKSYTREQALKISTEYFTGDTLAADVFVKKYALSDGEKFYEASPKDMHKRLSKEFARIEKSYPNSMTEDEIFNLLDGFKYIVPQGSPMSSIGNDLQIQSTSNCFVVKSPYDSYGGILMTDQELVQIAKRRGGIGFDISTIRPKGMRTNNAAKTTDGIVVFMDRYSNSTREVAQNGRRGALMLTISVHHPEILAFINAKRNLNKVTGANISVRLSDEFMQAVKDDKEFELRWPVDSKDPETREMISARSVWDNIVENAHAAAEPGLLFWDTAKRMTPSDIYEEEGFGSVSTNPCFSKDTLIAVADGRNSVSIGDLAKEGLDVPVYSLNPSNGMIEIKTGRNPRKTGSNKKLLRVHLDDESYIDTTENHNFITKDGKKIQAKDLSAGESLPRFSKTPFKMNKDGNEYYQIHRNTNNYKDKRVSEHRLISEFNNPEAWILKYDKEKKNGWVDGGLVIHHKDYNGLNNTPSNLEVMTFKEHQKYHADHDCSGENNGRFIGISSEEIKEHAMCLTKSLVRKFSNSEWLEYAENNNLPKTFSKMHHKVLGNSPSKLATKCCIELGLFLGDPRLTQTLSKALSEGYNADIVQNKVFVEKNCEGCQSMFNTEYHKREISFCSHKCYLVKHNNNTKMHQKRTEKTVETHTLLMEGKMTKQAKIWSELNFHLKRKPLMKEWEQKCKEENISYRLKTKYGFQNFKEVYEAGQNYNHKVVKVEELPGLHDVYNITVDDNHTVSIITKEKENECGTKSYSGVSVANCGEIILSPYDSCRLLLVNLLSFVNNPYTADAVFDYELYDQVIGKAQRLMDDMIDLELEKIKKILAKIEADDEPEHVKKIEKDLWVKVRNACETGRRTGLGVTAVGDTLAALGIIYGSTKSISVVEKIYKHLCLSSYAESIKMAEERGSFAICNVEKEMGHPFIKRILDNLPTDIVEKYKKYGRRNIANTTTAPAGSVSCETQTTSGIEPAYLLEYKRRRKLMHNEELEPDFVDDIGDRWVEYKVYHHGFRKWMEISGKERVEDSPYFGATSNEIDWVSKIKMQAAAQKWICHAISNCVAAGETSIFTDKGMFEIEELAGQVKNNEEFSSIDFDVYSINKEGNKAKITQAYNNGQANVIRISCGGGRFITCTPFHKLVVVDENNEQVWRTAKDIQVGDVVVGRKGLNLWNNQSSQSSLSKLVGFPFEYNRKKISKDIKIPKRMTGKLARLLGYMFSDGFVSKTGIGLSQIKNDAAEDFCELVEEIFHVKVTSTKDNRASNLYSWRANSKELAAFMRWIGVTRHDENMRIPLAIRCSGKRYVKEFIRGLTLDGHVSECNLCVMTSISRRFLEQTQSLLLNMGIDAGVYQCHKECEVTFPAGNICKTKDAWSLIISHSSEAARYLSMVGFAEDRKSEESVIKFQKSSRVKLLGEIPDYGLRTMFRSEILPKIQSNSLYEKFNSLTSRDRQGCMLARESLLEMVDLGLVVKDYMLDTTYAFRQVVKVEKLTKKCQTYDLTVPNGNAYIANGFVSHNTTNVPEETSVEKIKKIYMTGWEQGCKGVTVYRDGSRSGVLVADKKKSKKYEIVTGDGSIMILNGSDMVEYEGKNVKLADIVEDLQLK